MPSFSFTTRLFTFTMQPQGSPLQSLRNRGLNRLERAGGHKTLPYETVFALSARSGTRWVLDPGSGTKCQPVATTRSAFHVSKLKIPRQPP